MALLPAGTCGVAVTLNVGNGVTRPSIGSVRSATPIPRAASSATSAPVISSLFIVTERYRKRWATAAGGRARTASERRSPTSLARQGRAGAASARRSPGAFRPHQLQALMGRAYGVV